MKHLNIKELTDSCLSKIAIISFSIFIKISTLQIISRSDQQSLLSLINANQNTVLPSATFKSSAKA
jgi:hypothetical protein